jgi:hypothetical protein
MRRLGTRFIRIMSWPNDGLAEGAWRSEVLARLMELARIAAGEGIVLADTEDSLRHGQCRGRRGRAR